jgi:hypothetical protein
MELFEIVARSGYKRQYVQFPRFIVRTAQKGLFNLSRVLMSSLNRYCIKVNLKIW